VTAAYLNAEPLKALCEKTDAFSVGLKGFDDKFYREIVGGELKPVLDALQIVRARGPWLEVVTLIVPTHNDRPALVGKMAKWIATELGGDTPLHLTRFVPEYRLRNLPRTPLETLEAARKAALDAGLRFVYLGNVPGHAAENTLCPFCQAMVVTRVGFKLLENRLTNGTCPQCGAKLPGRWQ
jgi:pyruvate formate lyase activating enzyme